jgi:hypothetical protein
MLSAKMQKSLQAQYLCWFTDFFLFVYALSMVCLRHVYGLSAPFAGALPTLVLILLMALPLVSKIPIHGQIHPFFTTKSY